MQMCIRFSILEHIQRKSPWSTAFHQPSYCNPPPSRVKTNHLKNASFVIEFIFVPTQPGSLVQMDSTSPEDSSHPLSSLPDLICLGQR